MHTARSGHNAALLSDGKVIVIGGGTKSTEVYDPATGQWTQTAETSQTSHNGIVVLQNGDILAVGGDPGGLTAELFTDSPAPTPPAPFLDLPWDYEGKGLMFNEAALNINSYFDHTYPLLSSGLSEPATLSAQVTTYDGKSRDDVYYSSHDGYDYGSPAGISDGDPVFTAGSGWATYKYSSASGNMILIDHENRYQTRYMHMYLDGLIASPSGKQKVWVNSRDQIGKAGHTGNCYILGTNSNRVYNTPACAHIHFMVIQDKNKDGNFEDNIPDGVTDPFGWQSSEPDPWETYSFTYNNINHTGNKSHYLWTKKLPGIKETVTSTGGTYTAGDVSVKVEPDTFDSPVTLEMDYAQGGKASDSIWTIGTVINITAKNILGDFVTLLSKPVKLIWQPFKDADLSRFKPGTFYLYSSKDGNQWTKEQQVDPFVPGNITTTAGHFTYFAIMGERKDLTSPTTTAELQGLKGQGNWFRDDVSLTLIATDSASEDPAGVKNTYYKINDDDWVMYNGARTFTEEGNYKISYYSNDNDGNIEDVKTIEFDIDKTLPTVSAIPDRIPDTNGWYNKPVTITFTGQDSGSGMDTCTDPIIYKESDNMNVLVGGNCTDKAGNIGLASIHFKYDSTAPELAVSATSKGQIYTSGSWTNADVQISFSCTDDTSGVKTVGEPVVISTEGKEQSVNGACEDNAGNKSEISFTGINIDRTKPVVSISATPDTIWPPNGKMVDILISGGIVEENPKNTELKVIDEYGAVQPILTGFNQTIKLEAKRNGNDKDGRKYIIQAIAEDKAGNTSEAVTTVLVPHDQGR